MNRLVPLSPEARRLLELGSQVEPPTPEQNERMDRSLAALFRAGRAGSAAGSASPPLERSAAQRNPAPASAREPGAGHAMPTERDGTRPEAAPEISAVRPRPSLSTRSRFESFPGLRGVKPWLALGALAATASASFWLGRVSSPADAGPRFDAPDAAGMVAAPASAPSPPLGAQPLEENEPRIAAGVTPATDGGESALRVAASPSSDATLALSPVPSSPSGAAIVESLPVHTALDRQRPLVQGGTRSREPLGLGAEIEQLARVEAALRQGRAQQAVTLLDQRTVHHLQEQAAALRAIASCELHVAGAAAAARAMLERWPASAFQPRIANACEL